MGPRLRRLIAALATLVFLAAYIWAAIAISDRLPDNLWIDFIFFGVAGLAWSVPLIPLLAWAEGGGRRKR